MAQELAFAAPRGEEMTKVVTGVAGAGITGVGVGTVTMFAKKMGALEPFLAWGALLGAPVVGIAGALFTRGMIGDLFQGIAAGGTGILGFSLPAMLAPELFERKATLTPEQRALLAAGGSNIKLLGGGPAAAAEAAKKAARAMSLTI